MATPTSLPASFVAGAILTADQQNSLRGAFRVLQVVQGTPATAEVSNSTATYASTGLSATITPQSSTSKVLVMTRQDMGKTNGNAENRIQMRLMRGATAITETGQLMCYTGTAIINIISQTFNYLDSPATTSATTYTTEFMNPHNVAAARAQYGGGSGIMILMEISA
jgi:hypothetical protein